MGSAVLARSELDRGTIETAAPEVSGLETTALKTAAGPISLHVTSDIESVAAVWQELQGEVPCTSAQTYDWARAWSAHLLSKPNGGPVIAVGYGSDGRAAFLLPFETVTTLGLTALKWIGQDHANYAFGLFRQGYAENLEANDVSAILNETGRRAGAAAALLEAQPFAWDGTPNPLALLPHQPAPNSGYAVALGDFQELYESCFKKRARQGLLRKERRLNEAGALKYGWAETESEKDETLATFFSQKAAQFAAMGVTDVFVPEAQAFYRDLVHLSNDSPSRLRLGYVSLDGEILATFSGTVTHRRMCVLLSSLADSPFQRQSPGAQLLRHQIEEACTEGLRCFDLGVGAARHKSEWSNEEIALFDTFIALKPEGAALTLPRALKATLKRAIKSNPKLWSMFQSARKWVAGREA